jgi:hypothetical protein
MRHKTLKQLQKPRGHIYGAKFEGVPVTARVVRVIVGKAPEPHWWCAGLEGESRLAIEVIAGDTTFYVDNNDGFALWQMTKGNGSAMYGYNVIPIAAIIDDPEVKVFYK